MVREDCGLCILNVLVSANTLCSFIGKARLLRIGMVWMLCLGEGIKV